ncbi:MAG: DUF4252 domain-containing protein [Saprospiraceae bacterium]|nr:DUF4252 domain-containing protein [Saprospiraceae bacterium]
MKYLKWTFTALLFAFFLVPQAYGQDNAIDKYFKQYVDDDRFSVVYISPKLFELVGKLDLQGIDLDGDEEAKAMLELAQDMKALRILKTEINPGAYYKEAKNKIDTREYEVLMTVRDNSGEDVEFLIKEEGNIISELLLLVGGSDEFVLLSFVGALDIEKISRLARSIDK